MALTLPRAHRTPQDRAEQGSAARRSCPPEEQGDLALPADRRSPVDLLAAQAEARVPELVPVRHGRMMASPFAFYRGAAAVMAMDLAGGPVSGLGVQLCGDAHLANFGVFASPERRLMFDLNDFDETTSGPWEWDLKRLATSLVVAGRQNQLDAKARRKAVTATVRRYRDAMRSFAGMRALDVWYARAEMEEIQQLLRGRVPEQRARAMERAVAKARRSDSLKAFEKLTEVVDGEVRIKADPPLLVPLSALLPDVERHHLELQVRELLGRYRETLQSDRRVLLDAFDFVDMARKVVGVGSVGTRCWIVLLRGRDERDPLFLQVKEAQPSVLEPFVPATLRPREPFANQGERVVAGQRLMQAASDIFLGWQHAEGIDGVTRDFYVRQLRDQKGSAVIEQMEPRTMRLYGELCGWTLARAHARSGDPIAISTYVGDDDAFPSALADFSEGYADQNERDHAALVGAVADGRLMAATGM
jgi:uncharacterized protein (DUF2252 family)